MGKSKNTDELSPLDDPANGGTNGLTATAEPEDEDAEAKADANDTKTIQSVEQNKSGTVALPVADPGQVKAAAMADPTFIAAATTATQEAASPINPNDGPAQQADYDAMVDRALVLVKRHYGAATVQFDGNPGDEGQRVKLIGADGKEVGSGTLGDLLKEAKEALPDAEEVPTIIVPNVSSHAINNLDDLKQGLGFQGITANVQKQGDHYLINSSGTDDEGNLQTHADYVTVNAKKDELTKFYLAVMKAIKKVEKTLEGLVEKQ